MAPFSHELDACRQSGKRGGKASFLGSSVTRKHLSRKQRPRHSHSAPPSEDHQRSVVIYRATLEPLPGESKYCIHVIHRSGLRWKVCRSICEFGEFHDELVELLDTKDSDLLPRLERQVSWVPNCVQGLLAESKDHGLHSMQAYLDDVLRVPRIAQLEPVLRLLGVQPPEPPTGLRLAPRSWGHELEVRPSRACSTSEDHQGPVDGYKIEIQHLETGTCFPITREVGWSGLLVQKAQVGQLATGNHRFTVSAFNSAGESETVSIVVNTSTNQSPCDGTPQGESIQDRDGPAGAVPSVTLPAGDHGAAVHPPSSQTQRRTPANNCVHIISQRAQQVNGPGTSMHAAVGIPAGLGTVHGGSVQTATSEFVPLSLVQAFAAGHMQCSANRPSRDHALISAQALPAQESHLSPLREHTGNQMQGGIASPRLHDHTARRVMPAPRRYLRARVLNSFTGNIGAALPHHDVANPAAMMSQGPNLARNEASAAPLQQQSPNQAGNEVTQQENQRCAESLAIAEAPHHLAPSEQLCVVCLTKPKTHAFVPCGHRCVCASCGPNLCRETGASCPVCRAPAQQLLHVFV